MLLSSMNVRRFVRTAQATMTVRIYTRATWVWCFRGFSQRPAVVRVATTEASKVLVCAFIVSFFRT
ncbi:hypothetical protein BC629DRAFT_1473460 [Irpex lacteus]|nr:hypothetical protein BC629DRAFT_1473460 [Irpex lacteus]